MRPEQTVMIIGGKLKIIQKAKQLGLDVILIQHPQQLEPAQPTTVDAMVLADYTDWSVLEPLARAAQQAWGFSAVLSLTEPGLDPAARVNDLFQLPGVSFEVSHRLKDKWLMRQHLAQCGASTIAATLVEGAGSITELGRRHGYPVVVKPTDITASAGVFLVSDESEVESAWRQVLRLRQDGVGYTDFFPVRDFIAEAYVPGPEFSVEAFSFAGRHVVLAVTEKSVLAGAFVEIGHALPARLATADEAGVIEAAVSFLDVIGLRDGPSHTEVKVGPDGPVVIESHNRVGGDRINELVAAAYGIDLDTYAIGWPFRLVEELPDRPVARCSAATQFFYAAPGRVVAVDGAEELRQHPAVVAVDVNVAVGDLVAPLAGNWQRLGQLVVTGSDTEAAVRGCEQLAGKLTITTVPEP